MTRLGACGLALVLGVAGCNFTSRPILPAGTDDFRGPPGADAAGAIADAAASSDVTAVSSDIVAVDDLPIPPLEDAGVAGPDAGAGDAGAPLTPPCSDPSDAGPATDAADAGHRPGRCDAGDAGDAADEGDAASSGG